jgi:transposase InsO family protein
LTRGIRSDLGTHLVWAIVLDVFGRKVVGWAMEAHLRTELVLQALQMAIGTTDAGECDP